MPIDVKIPENPSPITSAMPLTGSSPSAPVDFTSGIPPMIPKAKATTMIERKGWIFHLEIMTIIRATARMKTSRNGIPVIGSPLCGRGFQPD